MALCQLDPFLSIKLWLGISDLFLFEYTYQPVSVKAIPPVQRHPFVRIDHYDSLQAEIN